jgi:hypothetical protein
MKVFVSILLIALLSFAASLYIPWWWIIAVIACIVSVCLSLTPAQAFLSGFLGVFILWLVMVLWISVNNDEILARRISLLILQMDNPVLLYFATAFIGGLVGGLGALAGGFLLKKKRIDLPDQQR